MTILPSMVASSPVFTGMMAAKLARPIDDGRPEPHAGPVGRSASGNELSVLDEREIKRQSDDSAKTHSLYGAKAALRHAVTELLFYSSIGDLLQLQRVCRDFNVNVRSHIFCTLCLRVGSSCCG